MMIQPFGDNFISVVPTDYLEHTPGKPFCCNECCICRKDQETISKLNWQSVESHWHKVPGI